MGTSHRFPNHYLGNSYANQKQQPDNQNFHGNQLSQQLPRKWFGNLWEVPMEGSHIYIYLVIANNIWYISLF
jgi:hypothetical protein